MLGPNLRIRKQLEYPPGGLERQSNACKAQKTLMAQVLTL